VSDVGILVDSGDDSYCPKVITVRANSSMDGLRAQTRIRRDYSQIVRRGSQSLFLQALEGNIDPSIRIVEIGIADSGGINCKVRGVLVRGSSARFCDNRLVYAMQQALKGNSSSDHSTRQALEFMATLQSHPLFTPAPPFAQPMVYESAHPYSDKHNAHKQPTGVKVAGASRYEVKFDLQCCTETDSDTLIFTAKGEPLSDGLYHGPEKSEGSSGGGASAGSGSGWEPLLISSDEFEFKFVTESGNGQWGYKFTVVPIKDCINFSFFGESLQDSLAVSICELCITDSGAFGLPFTTTAEGEIAETNLVPILQGCLSRCMSYEHIRSAIERTIALIFIADLDGSKLASCAESQVVGCKLRCGMPL
jgi:hypothetical protein